MPSLESFCFARFCPARERRHVLAERAPAAPRPETFEFRLTSEGNTTDKKYFPALPFPKIIPPLRRDDLRPRADFYDGGDPRWFLILAGIAMLLIGMILQILASDVISILKHAIFELNLEQATIAAGLIIVIIVFFLVADIFKD